jgi:tRNA nucleotidyltransferase (CCA-adding enzyme)
LARITARDHGIVARAMELRPDTIVALLERCDAFRKPQRFIDMLHAVECDYRGRTGFAGRAFPQAARLEAALRAARTVDAGAIAVQMAQRCPGQPQLIQEAIHTARIAAVRAAINVRH